MGDDATQPKYLIVNADEMEPGTFKDRLLLESATAPVAGRHDRIGLCDSGRCRLYFFALGI